MPLFPSDFQNRSCEKPSLKHSQKNKNTIKIIDYDEVLNLLNSSGAQKIFRKLLKKDPDLKIIYNQEKFEVIFSYIMLNHLKDCRDEIKEMVGQNNYILTIKIGSYEWEHIPELHALILRLKKIRKEQRTILQWRKTAEDVLNGFMVMKNNSPAKQNFNLMKIMPPCIRRSIKNRGLLPTHKKGAPYCFG